MSRKTAAGMYDKMDSLIQAINRLAESQEKANEVMAQMNENNRQHFELSMKQYALNIDNHQFNREQAEKVEEQDSASDFVQAIKDYVDKSIKDLSEVVNREQEINTKLFNVLHTKIEAKADKTDEKELAESIWKKLNKRGSTAKRP